MNVSENWLVINFEIINHDTFLTARLTGEKYRGLREGIVITNYWGTVKRYPPH